jgi:catechol 2,3-dioxygenase-like lactoylglutathione lyase family enzyme
MLRGIDHIVIVVRDLEAAIASYGQLGFTVVRGGKHPIGSHNALIAFADGAYIELIAFLEPGVAHPWNAALGRGGGLVDYCMATDDLRADVDAFRHAGAAISDPAPLSRERPDGYKLSWVLAIPGPPWSGVAPFLIEDETPRDERVPRERSHRNGAIGIRALTVAVESIDAIREVFGRVLRIAGAPIERYDLGARGVRFRIGPHDIEFVAPAARSGPIADWLATRGPSPYAATLVSSPAQSRTLDSAPAQNARLAFG